MSLSATISLPNSTAGYNQKVLANVTISNSGGSNVNLSHISPQILASGSEQYTVNIDSRSSGPGLSGFSPPYVIPASGSLIVPFSFVCFSPQVVSSGNLSQSVPTTYSINANMITSDGSSFNCASPATLTISPIAAN